MSTNVNNNKENDNLVKIMRNITTRAMVERLAEGDKLFQNMSSKDFMFMLILSHHVKNKEDKIYIADIANYVHLPIRKVSNIVQQLAEQDWITWKFDGNGDEGTYVELTENGVYATKKQKKVLEKFYNAVIDEFGEERFVKLMADVAELEEVMNKELSKMEE